MRRVTLSIVICLLLLTACNLPTAPAATTPTNDAIATKVSQLLTAAPTFTQPAEAAAATQPVPAVPSNTPVPPTATTAPQAAATIAPSPTLPNGDPRSSLGTPTWHDTLDGGKSFYQYENDNTRVVLDNGALALSGLSANGWLGWSLTYSHPAQNFYLEATFIPQACSGADMYGLVFRSPRSDGGYFFGVTCDGKYNLHARDLTANTDNALVQLTANSAIHPGSNQTNRLGVMASGDKLRLYANGILLQEIIDSEFSGEGDFGALVAANATAGFTVRMDEISLWKQP